MDANVKAACLNHLLAIMQLCGKDPAASPNPEVVGVFRGTRAFMWAIETGRILRFGHYANAFYTDRFNGHGGGPALSAAESNEG